jgi:hypothetical protein
MENQNQNEDFKKTRWGLRSYGWKNLMKALLAVQAELGKVYKAAANPHFRSRYADLETVMDAAVPVLQKHGLVVLQPVSGEGTVTTMVVHAESGEFISSSLTLPPDPRKAKGEVHPPDAQSRGSAISYARRYSLMGMLGLVGTDEDDDAERAVGRTKTADQALQPPNPAPTPTPPDTNPQVGPNAWLVWLEALKKTTSYEECNSFCRANMPPADRKEDGRNAYRQHMSLLRAQAEDAEARGGV